MKLKDIPFYTFLFLPVLLTGQFEAPYTFFKKSGDTLHSEQLSVTLTPQKKVSGFKVGDTIIGIQDLAAFSFKEDYYGVEKDKKGNLNLLKRYWEGKEIQLFYKNTIEAVSLNSVETTSKKRLYYRKGTTGSIRPLKYENVKIDFGIWVNKKNTTPFDKIERIRKLRKLNNWLIIGSTAYNIFQLSRNITLTPWMAVPPVLLSFTLIANNKEKELLERTIKEMY